jgi:hypothetical protein
MSNEATLGPFIKLLPHQDAELFDSDHRLLHICGGRGSGKSEVDYLHYFMRSERCVDQPYGLFANTEAQVQTFVARITEKLDEIGMLHVYETQAPKSWRKRWKREGIAVPHRRLRNLKFWIWEDGTHVFVCSMVGNAYARAKSLDLGFALIEEATEPGVTKNALTTIIGCVRCGLARREKGETESECRRRGHNHQVIVKYNVPLHEPGHFIYRWVEELGAKEAQRKLDGKRPYFRMITSSTKDNPHTGDEYDDTLRAAMDADTYEQQTSGKLVRNVAATSYFSFSEKNVLGSLVYDPTRPLHIWFDFNTTPATAGWGHDLRFDEVPSSELRSGRHYFGIVGELFSGDDAMVTEQVAHALVEDPTRDERCKDCGDQLADHLETGSGFLCRLCSYQDGDHFCSGAAIKYEASRKYIHAPENWRGLFNHRGRIYVYGDATGGASHSDAAATGGSIRVLRDVFSANLGRPRYVPVQEIESRC